MLYVYTQRASVGARDLAEEIMLQGLRARKTKGQRLRELVNGDAVVCWGAHFTVPAGVKVLNNVEPISKFTEVQKLREANVPTVEVSRTRPAARPAQRPAFAHNPLTVPNTTVRNLDEAQVLLNTVTTYVNQERNRRLLWEQTPVQPAETWLPRRNNHIGGADLLTPDPNHADFWSKKEDIVEEYRVHMFKGKSIRAGKKVQQLERDGRRLTPHAWIRSFDAGWIIQYDNFESTEAMRKIAKDALKALGLDFGAVDIGKKRDGSLIVFEVNRAPGIEGNTLATYARKIVAWANGTEEQQPRGRNAR